MELGRHLNTFGCRDLRPAFLTAMEIYGSLNTVALASLVNRRSDAG